MVTFAQSERSQRSYVLSRDPKVFPFGVSFVSKGTHHSSLFLQHINIQLSASQEGRGKNIHIHKYSF